MLAFIVSMAVAFDCSRTLTDLRDDDAILEAIKDHQKETGNKALSIDCI
jgi:hypothetical protein